MRERIREIAFFQNFGISMVVIGHAMENIGPLPDVMAYLHKWIYSFHMPLFMFIAGYLFLQANIREDKFNFYGFLRKRFLRLIVPYVLLSSFVFLLKGLIFNKTALRPVALNLGSYLEGIFYPAKNPVGPFWFLPTLFLISASSAVICHKIRAGNKTAAALLTLVCLSGNIFNPFMDITFLNISGVIHFYWYYWLGFLFALYNRHIQRLTEFIPAGMFIIFFLLSHGLISTGLQNTGNNLINAMCGIIMTVFLGRIYVLNNIRFPGFIDGYYYQIYLLSYFFHHLARVIYGKLETPFYLSFTVSFWAALLAPVLITKIINRYCPALNPLIGAGSFRGR